ncbi:MAG TPA: CBS domain-containing protein [Geminicoccaceae bacterium]|nr:CBS domain-containing protein [Geminicoccus sp.]HMU48367.1 CBS domain-containing protein [Geminicoccaceae bacterium]
MQRNIIPGVVDGQQSLSRLGHDATALEAAQIMRERRIGAVMIVEDDRLVGIVTERDLVFRLVAAGLDPAQTRLGQIMTSAPETLAPDDSPIDALDKMRAGRYRHLPVLDGGEIVGMVSIRDLYEAVRAGLQEDLQSAETLIYGEQYGAVATIGVG